MTSATPSTPRRHAANWAGSRPGTSRTASSRRRSGTWTPAPGGSLCTRGSTAASASACSNPPTDQRMSGQPILVAGKTGQLARCLVQEASWRGTALVAMGRPELDLTQPDALARAVEAHVPRAIVNAAAYTAVDKAEAEPALAMAVNRDGPGALAAAAARLGVPFIHVSTDYVFDGRKHGAYVEEDAPA